MLRLVDLPRHHVPCYNPKQYRDGYTTRIGLNTLSIPPQTPRSSSGVGPSRRCFPSSLWQTSTPFNISIVVRTCTQHSSILKAYHLTKQMFRLGTLPGTTWYAEAATTLNDLKSLLYLGYLRVATVQHMHRYDLSSESLWLQPKCCSQNQSLLVSSIIVPSTPLCHDRRFPCQIFAALVAFRATTSMRGSSHPRRGSCCRCIRRTRSGRLRTTRGTRTPARATSCQPPGTPA